LKEKNSLLILDVFLLNVLLEFRMALKFMG